MGKGRGQDTAAWTEQDIVLCRILKINFAQGYIPSYTRCILPDIPSSVFRLNTLQFSNDFG